MGTQQRLQAGREIFSQLMGRWTSMMTAGFLAVWSVVWETLRCYLRQRSWRLAAAVAFYALFALTPLLLFVVALSGFLFKQEDFQRQLLEQLRVFLGDQGASAAGEMLVHFKQPAGGIAGYGIALITLIFGATNALGQLRQNINKLWAVDTQKETDQPSKLLLKQLLYLAIVAAMGLLLLGSMFLSSLLLALQSAVGESLPFPVQAFRVADFLSTVVIFTVLCALIYQYLPDARARWRDAWVGAAVTAFLFASGKQLVAFVLSQSDIASAYGAVSSFIILLLWVYFSMQIILFGATFTAIYARRFGGGIHPSHHR